MKILRLRLDSGEQYYLWKTQEDLERIALKLLNERRNLGEYDNNPKLKDFVDYVTNEIEGNLAWTLVQKTDVYEIIRPEVY